MTIRMVKKLTHPSLAIVVLLALMGFVTAANADSLMDRVNSGKTIRLGFSPGPIRVTTKSL